MRDAHPGLGEMARVTRPGGTVAAAVWDYRGEMTLLRRFWDTAMALDPAATRRGRNMRFATPQELRELWASRLRDVPVGEAVVTADYDGFEDLWAPLAKGSGPAGAYASRSATTRRSRPSSAAGSASARSRSRSPPAPGSRPGLHHLEVHEVLGA